MYDVHSTFPRLLARLTSFDIDAERKDKVEETTEALRFLFAVQYNPHDVDRWVTASFSRIQTETYPVAMLSPSRVV